MQSTALKAVWPKVVDVLQSGRSTHTAVRARDSFTRSCTLLGVIDCSARGIPYTSYVRLFQSFDFSAMEFEMLKCIQCMDITVRDM